MILILFHLFLGISIENNNKKAFIQVITKNLSYFINYNIEDFKYTHKPFNVKIGKNTFSKEGVNINIKENDLELYGKIKYSRNENISTNIVNPNIMGPFSYIPSMECNHAILSMKNKANGIITINNKKMVFQDNNGYIEKDWGTSFPKSYIWCQGNNFEKSNASFMCSIADIPFKFFRFQGVISVLLIGDKEYKFTTYNNSKIIKYDVSKTSLNIVLKRENYYLKLQSKYNSEHKLSAPVNGRMEKYIYESVSSIVQVTLLKGTKVIFSDLSRNCGLEIV